MNKILLLTDFSELSGFAKSLADKIAYHCGAKLNILKIVDVPLDIEINMSGELIPSSREISWLEDQYKSAQESMTEWTNDLKAEYEASVIYGRIQQSISDTIASTNSELVVMGTHAVSGMKELLSGSIIENVILKNRVPVLSLKCDRENLAFKNFLITGDFEQENMDLNILKSLQKVFNSTFHLLWVNTEKNFATSSESIEKMKKFAKLNHLQNVEFHIHNDKSVEDGIINFSENYDATHDVDIDIVAIEKKNKSQLGYIITGCQATSFVNHIYRPLITYSKASS